ncbi:MAG: FAD-dependent oxidoreductase [Deltaproteobacteria bacterium]|nr:FAD-dependent oxidoreductase [Deltaproteobacteria bacterium]
MTKTVLIMGGGMGGLTAAHELAERGFAVTVIEPRAIVGGKARSYGVAGSAVGSRRELPAEHGFRFFPGFYKHVPDTMSRIPIENSRNGVLDHLVEATKFLLARANGSDPAFYLKLPHNPAQFIDALKTMFTPMGISPLEMAFFAKKMLDLLTSCDARRLAELEKISWWNFIDAPNQSSAYRDILARGATRSLVALRAEEGSARTVGTVLAQLIFDFGRGNLDRLLDGPTNEVWIDPWKTHLESLGVTFVHGAKITAIHADNASKHVSKVTVTKADHSTQDYTADCFVAAMPLEVLRPLLSPSMLALAPKLGGLRRLKTAWMNGIQFYLKRDIPLTHGHALYVDSPWALTSISQAQFWKSRLANYGDGEVRGILSVDISDWDTPGIVYGKPAKELTTREEIRDEVWAQLSAALNDHGHSVLDPSDIVGFALDESIILPNPSGVTNLEPLLINTVDSWRFRPTAVTEIANFYLAADFVQTHTDLATMEGANEAARRAVNGILDWSGSTSAKCGVFPLQEPAVFAPLKVADQFFFDLGLAHR